MTRHFYENDTCVRPCRKGSESKITTIPRPIVRSLNIQNADNLTWQICDNKIVITVLKAGAP
jgi:hypothetical protein